MNKTCFPISAHVRLGFCPYKYRRKGPCRQRNTKHTHTPLMQKTHIHIQSHSILLMFDSYNIFLTFLFAVSQWLDGVKGEIRRLPRIRHEHVLCSNGWAVLKGKYSKYMDWDTIMFYAFFSTYSCSVFLCFYLLFRIPKWLCGVDGEML